MLDLFVTPLTTVLITAFLTLGIIGPVFSTAETYILNFASWLITVGYGIGSMAMGALYPLTVVCGIHHMYNVIEAGMLAEGGLNIWMPIASAANFAQGAACLAVGLKAKDTKTKSVAIPSALSAALGITEPAIFGVNLRMVKPLVCGIIGGAVGAFFGAMFHIGATSYGVTGIPGFLITLDYTVQYAITLAISFAIAFGLTWVVWKEEAREAVDEVPAAAPAAKETPVPVMTAESNTDDSAEIIASVVYEPIKGNVIPRSDIPDPIFSSGVLGDGVGIEPELGEVVAPFDGEIASVTDTLHAVGLTGPNGIEMLIHVGIDTVNMKGDGFQLFVKMGDKVKAGQKLLTFDIEKIKAAGYSPTTAVLVANSAAYKACNILKTGSGNEMDRLIEIV
jgi:PTS system sucrose-specific IIC component